MSGTGDWAIDQGNKCRAKADAEKLMEDFKEAEEKYDDLKMELIKLVDKRINKHPDFYSYMNIVSLEVGMGEELRLSIKDSDSSSWDDSGNEDFSIDVNPIWLYGDDEDIDNEKQRIVFERDEKHRKDVEARQKENRERELAELERLRLKYPKQRFPNSALLMSAAQKLSSTLGMKQKEINKLRKSNSDYKKMYDTSRRELAVCREKVDDVEGEESNK